MKYLRTFEQYQDFDLGRFNDEDNTEDNSTEESPEFDDFDDDMSEEDDDMTYDHESECTCPDCTCGEESEEEPKRWGDEDEIVEKKKMNAGFAAYLANKKAGKKDDKKEGPKCKGKECDDKKEKGGKGLSAAQKKLPPALRAAIAKKNK